MAGSLAKMPNIVKARPRDNDMTSMEMEKLAPKTVTGVQEGAETQQQRMMDKDKARPKDNASDISNLDLHTTQACNSLVDQERDMDR